MSTYLISTVMMSLKTALQCKVNELQYFIMNGTQKIQLEISPATNTAIWQAEPVTVFSILNEQDSKLIEQWIDNHGMNK